MEVPESLCELAEACLGAADEVGDGWTAAQDGLVVAARAGGDTQGGFDVVAAHQGTADAAGTALGRLVSVLEIDADAVYLMAFDFSSTDEATASRFESTYLPPGVPAPPTPGPAPTPPPTSDPSPTPSPSPGPSPTPAPTPTPTPTPTP